MIVLGVESSCDETALAFVKDGTIVLGSEVASSVSKQALFGGVVPEVAAREHVKALLPLIESLEKKSGVSINNIDAVAVTRGPGLIGALLVGVSFAKALAVSLQKPLIPVDHVHAHVHGALLGLTGNVDQLFPALSLVISGGHSNIYYMRSPTNFEKLVSSIDDACGECFDKVGKILGTPYPGGPHIEVLARSGNKGSVDMPVMVKERNRLEFSYSGLKTHVLNTFRRLSLGVGDDSLEMAQIKADIAYSFQEEAFLQIARKIKSVQKVRPGTKSVIVSGGVAANQRFREIVAENSATEIVFPKLTYCSDNAAMIAALGFCLFKNEQDARVFDIIDWDPYSRQSIHT